MDNRSNSSGGGRHRPGSKKSGGRGHSSSQRGRGRGGAGAHNNNRDRARRQQQESEQSPPPSPMRRQPIILPGAQQASAQINNDGRRQDGHENNSPHTAADMLIGSNSASTSAVGAFGEPPSTATDCMTESTSQIDRCGGGNNNTLSADDVEEAEATDTCCASCGVVEVDYIKLKKCADCDLVRYCSDKCEKNHRKKHEAICKERAAELRDEILF
jgi:hypothetical protein